MQQLVLVCSANWCGMELKIILCEEYPRILGTAGHISVYIYLDGPGFPARWLIDASVIFDRPWTKDSNPRSSPPMVFVANDEWCSVERIVNECVSKRSILASAGHYTNVYPPMGPFSGSLSSVE